MNYKERKNERIRTALLHRQPDRVPVGEFFWTGFMERCRAKWDKDFDPYRQFDLDYIVITPNMDPRIQPFKVIDQNGGWIFQSDHSISSGVGPESYELAINTLRHYGNYLITV